MNTNEGEPEMVSDKGVMGRIRFVKTDFLFTKLIEFVAGQNWFSQCGPETRLMSVLVYVDNNTHKSPRSLYFS